MTQVQQRLNIRVRAVTAITSIGFILLRHSSSPYQQNKAAKDPPPYEGHTGTYGPSQ